MVSTVELAYFACLALSVIAGNFVSLLKTSDTRKWASTAIFTGMLIITCGHQAVHALLTVIVNLFIVRFVGPCHLVSFVLSFAYLGFFRSLTSFGFEHATPFANAMQLVLTLRVVGLAFEVHDSRRRTKTTERITATTAENDSDKTLSMERHLSEWQHISPSLLDALHYYFCYVGMFTGPYFKYKTYEDFTKLRTRISLKDLPVHFRRIYRIAFFVPAFVLITSFFDAETMKSDKFYAETTFVWRLLYIAVVFFSMRLRFYIAWIMAEAACVTSGLGAYPVAARPRPGAGPTVYSPQLKTFYDDKNDLRNSEVNFETVHNIDEFGCEFANSVRGVLRAWNMTVQYWLVWIVYKRVPNRTLSLCLTMLVSSYWHGLHGGYYLGLLSTTVFTLGEVFAQKAFNSRASRLDAKSSPMSWFTFCNWWYRVRAFEYMSAGFLLLTTSNTLRYWKSVYYVGHLLAVSVFLVSVAKLNIFRAKRRKTE